MALTLTSYGGAEAVTGSNFLVEGKNGKIVVDCGIEQGKDFCETCSYESFPYDVSSVDALVITHAHLDHIGRAPRLLKEGFKGTIYMTPPTRDLAEAMLRDSVRILARHAREIQQDPLYELADVDAFFNRVETLTYNSKKEVAPGLTITLKDAGHILGSAMVEIEDEEGTVLALTGDLGNIPSPLLSDTEKVSADVVLMESVYGDRVHEHVDDRVKVLKTVLKKAIDKGGAIMIPAFSIERTQLMLYELSNFFEDGFLPKVPVFLDSPLAITVTDVYKKWAKEYFKKDVQQELHREGDLFSFPFLHSTFTKEESQEIRSTPNPKIIIAGAGMSHGGRIGGHEIEHLGDPNSTLLIVGYQAPGSPGRMLQDGVKKIRVNRKEVKVKATIETIGGWSAHADREQLLSFAESCLPRTKTFIVGIGEPKSSRFLAQRIRGFLGVPAIIPRKGQKFSITKEGAKAL